MMWLIIITFAAIMLLWIYSYVQFFRDRKRYNEVNLFIEFIEDLAYDYQLRHIKDQSIEQLIESWKNFVNKYTFRDLYKSNKSLELENWYTNEEINKIYS